VTSQGDNKDRLLPVLAILAALGLLLYAWLQSSVFPTASLNLSVSRQQILDKARFFASKYGYDGNIFPMPGQFASPSQAQPKAKDKPTKDIESIVFTSFEEAKTFLEWELGLNRSAKLMQGEIPIWAWSVRFCREFAMEQFRVWLSPDGKLIGFSRNIEPERPMKSLNHQEAIYLASDFLKGEAAVVPGTCKLVRDENRGQLHRTDYTFVFEDQTKDYAGGKLRHYIGISGDKITGYTRYLFVPDSFSRKYENLRSYNNLLQNIASIFYGTLQIISVLVVPWAISRKEMRFRFAVFGGLIMALVSLLDRINDFESYRTSYDTAVAYSDFVLGYFTRSGASALGSALVGAILFGGADTLYRRFYPDRVALENFLRLPGFLTSEGCKALSVGYLVAGIHLGWIVLYYLLGDKLNFWCPSGIDSVETLSSAMPFYSAISLGLHAASQEETVARIVGLSIVQRATGKFWLANLAQAMIWAFMHSSYPQQPCFARGIELTVVGLFYGYILRRYGLLPCFIGHYLLDAFLDVKPLFSVGAAQPFLWFSSLLPLLPFALLLIVSLAVRSLRRSSHFDLAAFDLSLTNRALPSAAAPLVDNAKLEESASVEHFQYKGFSRRFRIVASLFSLLALVATFFFHLPVPGDNSRVKINAFQAMDRASQILKQAGINVSHHMVLPTLFSNVGTYEMQYLYEKVGREKMLALCNQTQPGLLWSVRYFRFRDPTEYHVELRGDGSEYSLNLTEDDDAPGKRISEKEATAIALAYIKRVHPEYKNFKLSKVSWEDEKNRRDYSFEFGVPEYQVGDAPYRFSLQVVGDLPCNFSQAWQIPEAWSFERSKARPYDTVLENLRLYSAVAVGIVLLVWVVGLLRSGVMRFRAPLVVALVLALVPLLEQVNHLPSFWSGYSSELTDITYITERALSLVQHCGGVFWRVFLTLTLCFAVFRLLHPVFKTELLPLLSAAFKPRGIVDRLTQRELWIDGIIAALTIEALTQLRETLRSILLFYYSPDIRSERVDILGNFPEYFSAVFSDLLELPQSFLMSAAGFVIAVGLYVRFCRNFWFYMLFSVVYDLIVNSGQRYWQDYLINVGCGAIASALLWYYLAKLARLNPVAYLVKVVLDDCLVFIYAIYAYGLPAFAPDLVALLLYLLSPLAVVLYITLRNKSLKTS